MMPKGTVDKNSTFCTSFLDFQDNLVDKKVKAIEISANSTIRVCNDPIIANQIAKTISTCKQIDSKGYRFDRRNCGETIIPCQGYDWVIGDYCGPELTVASTGEGRYCMCSNSNHVAVRPCNGWENWGGSGTGCRQDTTNLRVSAVIGNFDDKAYTCCVNCFSKKSTCFLSPVSK